jgi:hypothetical protein
MSEDNNNSGDKSANKVLQSYLGNHGKPVSRRQLLASGAIPFAASFAMPNWLKMFATAGVAEAQDAVCASSGSSSLPVFVQLKLNGGAAMSYNLIPHGEGGQLLSSYDRIGGGSGAAVQGSVLTNQFLNQPMFYSGSGMLAGILGSAPANNAVAATRLTTAISRSAMLSILCSSQDDSSANAFGMSGLIEKIGVKGGLLPNLGFAETVSGIAANPALVTPSAPLRVRRLEDVVGALGLEGALSTLPQAQKEKLFDTIKNLSAGQKSSLSGLSGGQTLSKLIECANIKNYNLIQSAGNLNISPLGNTNFSQIWGINANTQTNNQNFVFATMVYNALNGNAGSVSFDMGGFDYHGNPRATTDARDNQAGQVIGRVLQSFALMDKPGFIVVCSDGSVSSVQSDQVGQNFTSDRGLSGAMYIIAYHPTRNVTVAYDNGLGKAAQQLGWLTSGQAAESIKNPFGNNPQKAAVAAFLNYCGFAGIPMADYERVAARTFDTAQVSSILKLSTVA